mgnify:CR=1 FL=1
MLIPQLFLTHNVHKIPMIETSKLVIFILVFHYLSEEEFTNEWLSSIVLDMESSLAVMTKLGWGPGHSTDRHTDTKNLEEVIYLRQSCLGLVP